MISVREEEFLHSNEEGTFVVKIKEYYLFNWWCFRREELHSYNQILINAFKVQPDVKTSKIGFKSNSKQSKKKKNESKSKTNKS